MYGLALDWDRMVIYHGERLKAAHLIHEMGHLFACGDAVENSEEYDFFGWEWCLARMVGGEQEWRDDNEHYGINDFRDFGAVMRIEQDDYLYERLDRARELGIVVGETPIPIRLGRGGTI
jgi:hypothetical protein